jgi:uncharacterized membrane protein YhaH (DUF805 family)
MFENPFSFEGRIRRTEYGITIIITSVLNVFFQLFASTGEEAGAFIYLLLLIPLLWLTWAQGAKRCHDLGNSGWYQIIPFYGLWMLFQDGEIGPNKYGENPKQVNQTPNPGFQPANPSRASNTKSSGYSGGYSGGHNNQTGNNTSQNFNSNNSSTSTPNSDNSEYKSGNLYN